MDNFSNKLNKLEKRVAFRVRLQKGSQYFVDMLLALSIIEIIILLLWKIELIKDSVFYLSLVSIGIISILAGLTGYFLPLSKIKLLLFIDEKLKFKDFVTNSYWFLKIPPKNQDGFMKAHLSFFFPKLNQIKPKEVFELHLPRHLLKLGFTILLNITLFWFDFSPFFTTETQSPVTVHRAKGIQITDDDLLSYYEFMLKVNEQEELLQDPQFYKLSSEFNQLMLELASNQLDFKEAMEKIDNMSRLLPKTEPLDELSSEYLKRVGENLSKSKVMEDVGKNLKEKNFKNASEELKKLAQNINKMNMDKNDLNKLQKAFQEASKLQPPDLQKRLDELKKQQKSLLKQKQENKLSKREKSLLKKRQRELEQLSRNIEKQSEQQRMLSKLQKQMESLSKNMNLNDMPELPQELEKMSEDINRFAQQELTDEQMQEMAKRLEELKQLLQQLNRGGKGLKSRLSQFQKMARGGSSCKNCKLGQLVFGKGGGGLPIPFKTKSGSGMGGDKQGDKQAGVGGGKKAGVGHDPTKLQDPTKLGGKRIDISAEINSNEGEVKIDPVAITQAAEKGFVSKEYKVNYKIFEDFAEKSIEKEKVPQGFRNYIRRYFELIRPRE